MKNCLHVGGVADGQWIDVDETLAVSRLNLIGPIVTSVEDANVGSKFNNVRCQPHLYFRRMLQYIDGTVHYVYVSDEHNEPLIETLLRGYKNDQP